MAPKELHAQATDQEVIAYCQDPQAEFLGGTERWAQKVVQLGADAVVKFGSTVNKFEFDNLKLVKALVDPEVVYIPDAYRYFTDGKEYGYIVMEYVHGKMIDPLEDPERIQKIAKITSHLATFRGQVPGPLSRGPCNGALFPDNVPDHELRFDSIEALEVFWRRRLIPHNPQLTLSGHDLVLCHLDIAPRNIIWKDDGSVCLLDWAAAGYFPRAFEFAALNWRMGTEADFTGLLLQSMQPLSEHEEVQALAIECARGNCERYLFREPEEHEKWWNKSTSLGAGFRHHGVPWPSLS